MTLVDAYKGGRELSIATCDLCECVSVCHVSVCHMFHMCHMCHMCHVSVYHVCMCAICAMCACVHVCHIIRGTVVGRLFTHIMRSGVNMTQSARVSPLDAVDVKFKNER